MMAHQVLKPPMRGTEHNAAREYKTRLYVTSPPIARAHTGPSPSRKERAYEHCERSEALAQGSPLAHERGDDPRPDRYLPPLSSSRAALRSKRWCQPDLPRSPRPLAIAWPFVGLGPGAHSWVSQGSRPSRNSERRPKRIKLGTPELEALKTWSLQSPRRLQRDANQARRLCRRMRESEQLPADR
jgi:hypothetical protein